MKARIGWPLLPAVLTHVVVTALSVVIAFSLPEIAWYILFRWWPSVQSSSPLLFTSEVALASMLVSLFIGIRSLIANRHVAVSARLASLVHATSGGSAGLLTRWREKMLLEGLPASRDLSLLCITGRGVFGDTRSPMNSPLSSAYELRVLMLNPCGSGAQAVARSRYAAPSSVSALKEEAEQSITFLRGLRDAGRKVTLRFYDQAPFWRIAIHGGHAWVRYCHLGWEPDDAPEYVFALHPEDPKRGLFVAFHTHFLNQWNDRDNAEYDFDRRQLIYRDDDGGEVTRRPFVLSAGPRVREDATAGAA